MPTTTSVQLKNEPDAWVDDSIMGKRDAATLIEVVKMFPDEKTALAFASRAKLFGHMHGLDGRFVHVPFVQGAMFNPNAYDIKWVLDEVVGCPGVPIKCEELYRGHVIDWQPRETATKPWHGDLSFENIIIADGEVRLIDWRPSPFNGDIHYEYGKLIKSCVFNHKYVAACTLKGLCPHPNWRSLIISIAQHAEANGLRAKDVLSCALLVIARMSRCHMHVRTATGHVLGECLLAQAERGFDL